jgi:hypothetical protein
MERGVCRVSECPRERWRRRALAGRSTALPFVAEDGRETPPDHLCRLGGKEMKRLVLLALLAGCILYTPAVAHADDSFPSPAETSDGTVYTYDVNSGDYRQIPDADTAYSMAVYWCNQVGDWCGATHYNSTSDLPASVGSVWSSCSCQYWVEANGNVYQYNVDNGEYDQVPDADTAYSLGINWCPDQGDWCGIHDDSSVPGTVEGTLPSCDCQYWVETSDGTVYQYDPVGDQNYHQIPDSTTADQLGLTWCSDQSDWCGVHDVSSVPGTISDEIPTSSSWGTTGSVVCQPGPPGYTTFNNYQYTLGTLKVQSGTHSVAWGWTNANVIRDSYPSTLILEWTIVGNKPQFYKLYETSDYLFHSSSSKVPSRAFVRFLLNGFAGPDESDFLFFFYADCQMP